MATATRSRSAGKTARAVAKRYFDALTARDLDAMAACWAPEGVEHIAGQVDTIGPEGVRAYFGELFGAFPDLRLTVHQIVAEGDRAAVHWEATGTFAGTPYQGIEATGSRARIEGLDLLHVEDGLIVRNDAYTDGMSFARELGLMPPKGSPTEARMFRAFNGRTRMAKRIAGDPERVADGVWLVRGGFPLKEMNVYFIEDEGGGVTVFDAGIKAMTNALAATGVALGGINRLVLGHAHADHRGAAPGLRVPVLVHEADRADAEGDGGEHYFDFGKLGIPGRWTYPLLLRWWDGGPVEVADTVKEGDDVSGFRVVHVPGHAPGMIALFRESDRVALTSDTFYTINPETIRPSPPRVPHAAFNQDTEQARASIRKLAALEPAAAWPGPPAPVLGGGRPPLERAADTT